MPEREGEMAVMSPSVQEVALQAQRLSFEDRVRLINLLAESLLSMERPKPAPRQMVRGQFKGERMSTEEDFRIAEWHPSEDELNGN
jgi:hypothetical protein